MDVFCKIKVKVKLTVGIDQEERHAFVSPTNSVLVVILILPGDITDVFTINLQFIKLP